MNNKIIIILGIILLVFIILNHVTIVKTTSSEQGNCSQTAFGCCPDGVNSKINFYGTNCPEYRPGPGYYPNRPPYVPPPPPPIASIVVAPLDIELLYPLFPNEDV